MKLKDRFKILFSKKKLHLYKILIEEKDFEKVQNYKIKNVKKENDKIVFNTDFNTYQKLKKDDIAIYEVNYLNNYINKNRHKIILTITIVLLSLIIFCVNQFFVREVTFEDKKYASTDVYNTVTSYTKKIGPYLFLTESISKISNRLREEYYNFAYIGLKKKGSKLIIEIAYQDVLTKDEVKNNLIGNFVATDDAKICSINITSGVVIVSYNDVVKKDQVLVTSNLQYRENLFNSNMLTPIEGYIIGEVNEYVEIKVLKKETIKIYTGNITESYQIVNDNKTVYEKENEYLDSFKTSKKLLKIGNFEINRIVNYERKEIEIIRNKEEANEVSLIKLRQHYAEKFKYDKEKIVSIKLIENNEYDEFFSYYFFVKVRKNIVSFTKI